MRVTGTRACGVLGGAHSILLAKDFPSPSPLKSAIGRRGGRLFPAVLRSQLQPVLSPSGVPLQGVLFAQGPALSLTFMPAWPETCREQVVLTKWWEPLSYVPSSFFIFLVSFFFFRERERERRGEREKCQQERNINEMSYVPYIPYLVRVGLTFPKLWTPLI
uniref:Uncharacterized protein n=1 Tax=Myotis myotis TaxID=51298 RepID=A0A7J7S1X8_MYOMY|nr:hypothetical protein mMyoMyo1_010099 [Myotis myotis]